MYSMRNTVEDKDKLANKLEEDDKSTILEAIAEAESWLSSNDEAEKDDLSDQLKDLQRTCDPVIASIYA